MPKSLFKNSIYNVIYQSLNVLFPLIAATFVARILKAEAVGRVAYSQNIVQYFILLAALGIPNYGIREVAKYSNNREDLNNIFSELFFLNFLSSLLSTIIYYSLILSFPMFQERLALYAAVGLPLILNVFNVDWFYKGKEEFRYIAIRSSVVKLVSLLCIILFVKKENDYILYAFIHCLAVAGNYLFNMFHLRRYVRLRFTGFNLRRHLKPIIILFSTLITVELYTLMDTTMIGFLCSEAEVGYYTYAMKIVNIIISIITAVSAILLPRLSLYYENKDFKQYDLLVVKALKVLLTLSIPSMIGIFMIADSLIPVMFGKEFLPAVTTLRILSFRIILIAVGNLFGTQILMTLKKENRILLSTVTGAMINMLLNILLINTFGYNGAAIASVITEFCVTILQIKLSRGHIYFGLTKQFIRSIVMPVITMIFFIYLFRQIETALTVKLIVSVCIGSIIYVGNGLLLKNEILIELKHRLHTFLYLDARKVLMRLNGNSNKIRKRMDYDKDRPGI